MLKTNSVITIFLICGAFLICATSAQAELVTADQCWERCEVGGGGNPCTRCCTDLFKESHIGCEEKFSAEYDSCKERCTPSMYGCVAMCNDAYRKKIEECFRVIKLDVTCPGW